MHFRVQGSTELTVAYARDVDHRSLEQNVVAGLSIAISARCLMSALQHVALSSAGPLSSGMA